MEQKSRFYILDLVRLLAILTMIQGHTLHALVDPDIGAFPWNVWSFLRGLTAPVFLIVSGAVQIFANRRDAEGKLLRSVIVRRARWFLLILFVSYAMCFPSQAFSDFEGVSEKKWQIFFRVHILNMIGITGLVYLGVMALTRTNRTFAVVALSIAAAVTAATPCVHAFDVYRFLPGWIANYIGAPGHFGHDTLFPIFPFAAYMFLGAGLGFAMKRTDPAQRPRVFVLTTLVAGLLLAGAGVPGYFGEQESGYWYSNPSSVLLRSGLSLLGMCLVGLLYPLVRRIEPLFARIGKKALHIFVAHLLILYGGPGFGGIIYSLNPPVSLIGGIGVALGLIAVCVAGALLLDLLQRRFLRQGS